MLVTMDISDDTLQARVLRALAARLGCGVARVDFSAVAKELRTSRQAVAYNVKKLCRLGVLRAHGTAGFSVVQAEGQSRINVKILAGEEVKHNVVIPTTIVDRDNVEEFLNPDSPY